MHIPKKIVLVGLGLIIFVTATFLLFPEGAEKTPQVLEVEEDVEAEVSGSGVLTGRSSVDLKFKSGGKLSYIKLSAGDFVSEGELLAGLDNRDQSVALQQAQNTLKEKQAALDKVLDDIHLFQYGMGSFANIGTANETLAQRQLRTAGEVARDNAFDEVKKAQKALDDTIIFAPKSGIITQVNFVEGQTVSASDVIIKMVDTSETYFDAEIDEADIGKISLGQKAEVTLDAYGDRIFSGTVNQIIPQTKIIASGATVVTVMIKIEGPEHFINGLSGQASIIIAEAKNEPN